MTVLADYFTESFQNDYFQICFYTVDGTPYCSEEFTLVVCKYTDLSDSDISYNVWTGDDITYSSLLTDAVGDGFERSCYS